MDTPIPLWTGFYAGILGLMQIVLSIRVIRQRWRTRTDIYDAPDRTTTRTIRAHGNFAEYVPMALILIALVEIGYRNTALVHALGFLLVLARVGHAYSMSTTSLPARVGGMLGTYSVIAVAALLLLLNPWLD